MDVSVNKHVKDLYKNEFMKWYSKEMMKRFIAGVRGVNIMIDLRMSAVKPESLDWLITAHDAVNSEIVVQGFKKAGLLDIFESHPLLNFHPPSFLELLLVDQ